jgi:hypothetical protein
MKNTWKTEVENLVADSLMCLMYCIGIVMKQKWVHTFIFVSPQIRARTFKCLWGPGIDSKEWIPPAYVASGGTVRKPYSSSVPSPHRLFKNSSSGKPFQGIASYNHDVHKMTHSAQVSKIWAIWLILLITDPCLNDYMTSGLICQTDRIQQPQKRIVFLGTKNLHQALTRIVER